MSLFIFTWYLPRKVPSLTISSKIKYYIYLKLNFNGWTQLTSLYFFDNFNRAFFYKSSPHAKRNWHCTIGVFINTAPWNVCFILHYHLFFLKVFFSIVHNSLNTVFECFWLMVSCFLCRNWTLASFKEGVFVRNAYISPMRSISVVIK